MIKKKLHERDWKYSLKKKTKRGEKEVDCLENEADNEICDGYRFNRDTDHRMVNENRLYFGLDLNFGENDEREEWTVYWDFKSL